MKKLLLTAATGCYIAQSCLAGDFSMNNNQNTIWKIEKSAITLTPGGKWQDHFAMSGRKVDLILEWRVDESLNFHANRRIRFPMLRTIPDNTHASLSIDASDTDLPSVSVNGQPVPEGKVAKIALKECLYITQRHGDLLISETAVFPTVSNQAVIDLITITNISGGNLKVNIPQFSRQTETAPGVSGKYLFEEAIIGAGDYLITPGETLCYGILRSARILEESPYYAEPWAELAARREFYNAIKSELVLETPDPELNLMFDFCKFHTTESIFSTRGGLMHGPGGYNKYLAAIWANDQAEYANPFFPFLGNAIGNEAAMNSFRLFARYMNDDFKPIPSSIISEGRGFWNGAGDRGDMAMIAHGASRFVLASGNRSWAEELLPLIEWSLEYCQRQKTPDGVIRSDKDELEGRFPAGDANLCTATLYYDALIRTSELLDSLGIKPDQAEKYRKEAEEMHTAIIRHFSAEVEGFQTFRYYAGNTVLRSWICMPLVFGIKENAEGTIAAMFSDKLWLGDGLLSASSNRDTYWDRSTLYAFRGIFFCGFADQALPKLLSYTDSRLLGMHVPYPVEAYPEFNQSHLAAESALYCRIFTEGLFGIEPAGLDSFHITVNLPSDWDYANLRRIHAFGRVFDLEVTRSGKDRLKMILRAPDGKIFYSAEIIPGQKHTVNNITEM